MEHFFGVCNLSVVPLRAEPSDKSEMVSQLLFGDHFEITEQRSSWSKILTYYDNYEGWIDNKQFSDMGPDEAEVFNTISQVTGISGKLELTTPDQGVFNLVPGSSLPPLKQNWFSIGENSYVFSGNVVNCDPVKFKSEVTAVAGSFLNSPYLWGGRSPYGIDCSGFTQIVFKILGIRLKRDARLQAEQGSLVDFLQGSQTGDLAFFDNEEGRITHVGILLDNSRIIHASGKVRIDSIDHQGIYNNTLKRHTHNLRVIKRFS